MRKEKFKELVKEGIKKIPEKFLKQLKNVDIVVEDELTPHQLRKLKNRKNILVFGLYEGIPQTQRWNYSQVLPDKITIFQKPIEQAARSEREVEEIIKETIWHEIAHHFGLDEKRVKEAKCRMHSLGGKKLYKEIKNRERRNKRDLIGSCQLFEGSLTMKF